VNEDSIIGSLLRCSRWSFQEGKGVWRDRVGVRNSGRRRDPELWTVSDKLQNPKGSGVDRKVRGSREDGNGLGVPYSQVIPRWHVAPILTSLLLPTIYTKMLFVSSRDIGYRCTFDGLSNIIYSGVLPTDIALSLVRPRDYLRYAGSVWTRVKLSTLLTRSIKHPNKLRSGTQVVDWEMQLVSQNGNAVRWILVHISAVMMTQQKPC